MTRAGIVLLVSENTIAVPRSRQGSSPCRARCSTYRSSLVASAAPAAGSIVAGAVAALALLVPVGFGVADAVDRWWPSATPQQIDRSPAPLLLAMRDIADYHAASGTFQVLVDVEHDTPYLPSAISGERTTLFATGTRGRPRRLLRARPGVDHRVAGPAQRHDRPADPHADARRRSTPRRPASSAASVAWCSASKTRSSDNPTRRQRAVPDGRRQAGRRGRAERPHQPGRRTTPGRCSPGWRRAWATRAVTVKFAPPAAPAP